MGLGGPWPAPAQKTSARARRRSSGSVTGRASPRQRSCPIWTATCGSASRFRNQSVIPNPERTYTPSPSLAKFRATVRRRPMRRPVVVRRSIRLPSHRARPNRYRTGGRERNQRRKPRGRGRVATPWVAESTLTGSSSAALGTTASAGWTVLHGPMCGPAAGTEVRPPCTRPRSSLPRPRPRPRPRARPRWSPSHRSGRPQERHRHTPWSRPAAAPR